MSADLDEKSKDMDGRLAARDRVSLSRIGRTLGPYLPFIIFPLVLLWRPLFAGEAFFWGTPLLQFVPWQQLAANMWRSGHLPLWNHLVGCGAPLAANYQTAAFYPLNALHLLMPSEIALSWTVALHIAMAGWGAYRWGRAVKLDPFAALIAGLTLQGSGFLVARAALFPSIALTFPWIPVWLWRAEILIQRAHGDGTSAREVLRAAVLMGLALGLGLLAGHAQTACYGGLLVASYAAFRATQEIAAGRWRKAQPQVEAEGQATSSKTFAWLVPALRTAGLLLLSAVAGLGLAAVQLLPTGELLLQSQRRSGLSGDLAMTYSLWPWRLITALAPGFFGDPGRGTYWGYGPYWENAFYIGLLPLLLAGGAVSAALTGRPSSRATGRGGAIASTGCARTERTTIPWHRRRALTIFWAVSAAVTLTLALGKNLPIFPFLFRQIPGFDLFQAPARWLAITTVALALLSGIGAHRWLRGRRSGRLPRLGITIGTALLLGGLIAPRLVNDIPPTFGPATARLGAFLAVASMLASLRRENHPGDESTTAWWQAAVAALILLDLLTIAWPLVPTVDRSLYRGQTRTAQVLSDEPGGARIYWPSDPDHWHRDYDAQYRVKFDYLTFHDFGPSDPEYWWGMREAGIPNAGMLDHLATANNFDPLLVGRYADLLEAAIEAPHILKTMGVTHVATDRSWPGGEQMHTGGPATFYRIPNAPGRAWVVSRAQSVPSDQVIEAMRSPSFDPTETVIVEEMVDREPEADLPPPTVPNLVLQDGPNRVTMRVALDAPGYLVVADTWYPGWRAEVDGHAAGLLRANHAFRAIRLTAGEHAVEMVYHPTSARVGAAASVVTVGLLLFGIAISLGEKRGA